MVGCIREDTHQGFFATDLQLKVVLWNRWMEIHSGRSATDVLGRSLLELYPDVVERGIEELLPERARGPGHHPVARAAPLRAAAAADQCRRSGAAFMPQSGRIGPLTDGDAVVGTVTNIEDVSDRLASESALRQQIEAQQRARTMAENALRVEGRFPVDVCPTKFARRSTPYSAGRAFSSHATSSIGTWWIARCSVIERNASAQARMIDDMLDMARIAAGKLRLEMRPVDIVKVVLAAVDVVMPTAHAKHIAVRTSLDPRTPNILGDQDRLQQVIWNLLSNAVKFTDSGGSIEVRLTSSGRVARIVVTDSGHGISPAFLPHVFERFRQADASSSRRHGGLGVGLALVHDMIELHGGSVRAHSDGEGKGATFTIELPTVPSHETDNRADTDGHQQEAMASLAHVRVLLIDDEADARDMASAVLEHCGARVKAVGSSAEALAVLMEAPRGLLPHVIVSDLGMPNEDGYQLIRQIRTLDTELGRIPAVAVSGYATSEDVDRALAAGFQMHIAKPVDPAAFVAAVAQLARPDLT